MRKTIMREEDEEMEKHLLSAFASYAQCISSYDLSFGDSQGELFIRGNNLLDELGYNHASPLIKRYAPLPGA